MMNEILYQGNKECLKEGQEIYKSGWHTMILWQTIRKLPKGRHFSFGFKFTDKILKFRVEGKKIAFNLTQYI